MSQARTPVILASASPRRKVLLSELGFDFIIHAPDVDETIDGAPEDRVRLLAERKARAVAGEFESGLVIAADTLVAFGDQVLGKPCDERDACAMLSMLSANAHQVYTGICLMDAKTGRFLSEAVRSDVYFRQVSDEEIQSYINTGEPMDKAGAYAIQGGAAAFVEKYTGSYSNIVGFPQEEFKKMYERFAPSDTEENQ